MPSSPADSSQTNADRLSQMTTRKYLDMIGRRGRDREAITQEAISLFQQREYESALELFAQNYTPPDRVLALYPDSISNLESKSSENNDSNAFPAGRDLKLAAKYLHPYLAQMRKLIQRHLNFDGTLKHQIDYDADQKPLFFYLLSTGSPETEAGWQQDLLALAERVDTVLFLSYLYATPYLVSSLLRLPNFCSIQTVRQRLVEIKLYEDCITCLDSKGLHKEALDLLTRLGQNKSVEDPEMPQSLIGPKKTIEYLTRLSPNQMDLILKYARWPLEEDPETTIAIFTSQQLQLSPDDALEYFSSFASHKAKMLYLEHLTLNDAHAGSFEYHDQLIDLYIENNEHQRSGVCVCILSRRCVAALRREKLRSALQHAQNAEVERMLRLGRESGAASEGRRRGKRGGVKVSQNSRCHLCRRKLHDTGAVKILPQDEVVHWGCMGDFE